MRKVNKVNHRPLILLILIIGLFFCTINIRKPWLGKIGEGNNQFLTSQVLIYANNWYRENPLKLWFGMFFQPKSVEISHLKDREFYYSDLFGSIIPIYLMAKFRGHPPTASMIMKYNLLNQLFIAIFLALTVYLFVFKVLELKNFLSFIFSLIPITIMFFMPAPLYYFQNVYFSVIAGILPFVITIFLELLRDIYKGKSHKLINFIQKIVIFWGTITLIDFIFFVFVLYIKRIILGELEFKKKFFLKSLLFWLPVIIPLLFYVIQLIKFGNWNIILNKILFRAAITEEGRRFTYHFFKNFWFKDFKEGYGNISPYLFLMSLILYIFFIIITIIRKSKSKNIDKKIISIIYLYSLYVIPPFFTFFLFKNAIAMHRFFIIIFCVPFTFGVFVFLPISIFLFFKKFFHKKISIFPIIIITIFINIWLVIKTHKGYVKFFNNVNYRNIEVAKFVRNHTNFYDIVISPQIDISISHLNLLAYSMKNVYRLNNLFELSKIYKWLKNYDENIKLNFLILKTSRKLYFRDFVGLLEKYKVKTYEKDNCIIYKLGRRQILDLKPKVDKILIEKIKTALDKKDIITLYEAKDYVFSLKDSHLIKLFNDKYKKLLENYPVRKIDKNVSFVKYKIIPIGKNQYMIKFLFKVDKPMVKNWKIYLHGWVNQDDKKYLKLESQKYGFENWDFYPHPKTTKWKNYVMITHIIEAKPIEYRISIGLYRIGEGKKGNEISLGKIDFKTLNE